MENDSLLITKYADTNLWQELDKVPLWCAEAASIKQHADHFAQYLSLPCLRDMKILLTAVRAGVAAFPGERKTFAYASGYDATCHRYLGLKVGQQIMPLLEGMLVKMKIATAHIAVDGASLTQPVVSSFTYDQGGISKADQHQSVAYSKSTLSGASQTSAAITQSQSQRFYGSVTLHTTRTGRDATTVIEEVAQILTGLLDARVEITKEIHAEQTEGSPEHAVCTVTENCRTVKFTSYGFEERYYVLFRNIANLARSIQWT